jgi:hypothetical protein
VVFPKNNGNPVGWLTVQGKEKNGLRRKNKKVHLHVFKEGKIMI